MKYLKLIACFLSLSAVSAEASEDVLWKPSHFDGAYIVIDDDAKNGCWTNIGETRAYAEDQIELAGFTLVEPPETASDEPHPLLFSNLVEYRLRVKASRQDNGVCVGHLESSFRTAVKPANDTTKVVVGQLGQSYVWTVWNSKNLNEYLFDQVRDTIRSWVEIGETPLM